MDLGRKVKTLRLAVLLPVVAGLALALFSACAPAGTVSQETEERAYRRGKSLLREGRKDEALQAFLSVVSVRSDAAESNLEAGLLYLNHIKDPLAAIYHFRNYLALNPDGEYSDFVKELILTAQKDFAQTLPGEPFADPVDRVNLMERVKALQTENEQQKKTILDLQRSVVELEQTVNAQRSQLAQAQTRPASGGAVAPIVIQAAPQNQPAAASVRSYTVQAGDTLSRISAQVYGQTNRWADIYQANRDQLPSPNALKPGQVLRIP